MRKPKLKTKFNEKMKDMFLSFISLVKTSSNMKQVREVVQNFEGQIDKANEAHKPATLAAVFSGQTLKTSALTSKLTLK